MKNNKRNYNTLVCLEQPDFMKKCYDWIILRLFVRIIFLKRAIMSYKDKFITKLRKSEDEVSKANDKKAKVIDEFINDITDTCNICYDIWEEIENNIKKEVKSLGDKYQFTFPFGYNEELSVNNIVRTIGEKLPVFNYGGEHIIDSLPGTNEEWSLTDRSDEKFINIDIEPVDQRSRYPHDPENNQAAFYYIMPHDVHEKLLKAKKEEKEEIIREYINGFVQEYLNSIEETVKTKAQVVNNTINKIDFNNPAVVAELRKKLKM